MKIANASGKGRRKSPLLKGKEHTRNQRLDSRTRNLDNKTQGGKYEGKYDKYTPLNALRSQLWREIALTEMKKVDRPRPLYNKGLRSLSVL